MVHARWIILGVLVAAMATAHYSGLIDILTFETLKQERITILALVEAHPIAAPIVYVLLYTFIVACTVPGATVLTLAAGLLFPQPICTILGVLGASTGACIAFMIAKTALGTSVKKRVEGYPGIGKLYNRIRLGLKRNVVLYMLLLRLVPIFPFWLINVAPTILGVSFYTFAWTTYVGITPGTYVYTEAGRALSLALDSDVLDESTTIMQFLIYHTDLGLALGVLGVWLTLLLSVHFYFQCRYGDVPPTPRPKGPSRGEPHHRSDDQEGTEKPNHVKKKEA